MKKYLFVISALLSLSAQASDGLTSCQAYSQDTGKKVPLWLDIEWGEVKHGPGDLPPYSIHQNQSAKVTLFKPSHSESFEVVFKKTGGTTRCDWWQTVEGEIEGVAKIQFTSVWKHSHCGLAKPGATISFPQKTYDLECTYHEK